MVGAMPAMVPQVKANRLRGLGVTTVKRNQAVPDLPTIGETVPGYEVVLWYTAWGPKALPKDILTRLSTEVDRIVRAPEMKERMAGEGVEPVGGSPERFREALRRDVPKWQKVVKDGKISVGS